MECPICGGAVTVRQAKGGSLWQTCEHWPRCRMSATAQVLNVMARVCAENERLRNDLDKAHETVSRISVQLDESIRTGAIVATQLEESRATLKLFANGKVQE